MIHLRDLFLVISNISAVGDVAVHATIIPHNNTQSATATAI